jgi:hypothetical protein
MEILEFPRSSSHRRAHFGFRRAKPGFAGGRKRFFIS